VGSTARQPWVLLFVLLVGCDEHGKSPKLLPCSSAWNSIVTACEAPCVEPSVLRTDQSCLRDGEFGEVISCEEDRFANVDGHRGCCVFTGEAVEFIECNAGPPPDARFFPDAGEIPGVR
jgi:hypothetical protein